MTEKQDVDQRLLWVFYSATGRVPQEVIEWGRSPEGKAALEADEERQRKQLASWEEDEDARVRAWHGISQEEIDRARADYARQQAAAADGKGSETAGA
jgi:hypothetical protein